MSDPFTIGPEVLSVAQMREADRLAMARGVSGAALMERAGAFVAEVARDMAQASGRIVVLCGPGSNGGDGFVAARRLAADGRRVEVGFFGARERLVRDAAAAARAWTGAVARAGDVDLAGAALVIDALFGAGLDRAIEGEARALIERVNAFARAGGAVLAVDVPSGLDADSGAPCGVAVEARATATFFRFKPGHLLLPGRILCGEPHCGDIGVPDDVLADIAPRTFANTPALWGGAFPRLRLEGHKYSRGHAVALSGGAAQTGAARLAARGALRVGAGLVTLFSPRAALGENAAHCTAIMLKPCDGGDELSALLQDARINALVMGPGLGSGEAAAALARAALSSSGERALVFDADALTSFSGRVEALGAAIRAGAKSVVLTPHEGEFARLFGDWPGSKLERARRAAALTGASLLLKGADTVVAHPDGRASIGFDAPPWLATAGAGDVLAGMIAGLLAQGMPAFEAASAAVYLHGAAARAHGPGLVAEDIPEALPSVLQRYVALA